MAYRIWFIASFPTPLFFRYHLPLRKTSSEGNLNYDKLSLQISWYYAFKWCTICLSLLVSFFTTNKSCPPPLPQQILLPLPPPPIPQNLLHFFFHTFYFFEYSSSLNCITFYLWMRFRRVVRASYSQCRSRNCPVPEIIDTVFAKTSPKRSFSMTEYERFGLFFTKTRVYKFGHWVRSQRPPTQWNLRSGSVEYSKKPS